jgi:hypothetical protein
MTYRSELQHECSGVLPLGEVALRVGYGCGEGLLLLLLLLVTLIISIVIPILIVAIVLGRLCGGGCVIGFG